MIVLYVLGGLGVLWLLVRIEVLRAMGQRAALHEIEVKYVKQSTEQVNKRIDDLRHEMNAREEDLRKDLDYTRERITNLQKELRWLPWDSRRGGV